MRIRFSLPYAFRQDSSPEDSIQALRILRDGFNALVKVLHSKSGVNSVFIPSDAGWVFRAKGCDYPQLWIEPGFATFDVGQKLFHKGTVQLQNSLALKVLMDTLVQLNLAYLDAAEDAGIYVPSLYRSGVVYDRTIDWDTIPALYSREYGDCKSLTGAFVAQLRRRGHLASPVFRWDPKGNGDRDYHILVQTAKGWRDPSKVLGMGKNENAPSMRRSA